MKLALGPYIRFSRILLFPLAMVIYDFSAYLTTDLIQPGIIHIIREFEADVALAPASVSLYLAGGLALQWLLGPLSDRIGRRPVLLTGAIIFALACFSMIFVTSIDQYLIARFIREPVSASFRQSVMSPSRRLLMKKVYPHYGGADIHRFAGAGNRAPGGRWPDEFPALEVIVCDHRRHELAGLGVTDF